jgi:hypothetical protein
MAPDQGGSGSSGGQGGSDDKPETSTPEHGDGQVTQDPTESSGGSSSSGGGSESAAPDVGGAEGGSSTSPETGGGGTEASGPESQGDSGGGSGSGSGGGGSEDGAAGSGESGSGESGSGGSGDSGSGGSGSGGSSDDGKDGSGSGSGSGSDDKGSDDKSADASGAVAVTPIAEPGDDGSSGVADPGAATTTGTSTGTATTATTAAGSPVAKGGASTPGLTRVATEARTDPAHSTRVDTDAEGFRYRSGEIIAIDLDPAGLERVRDLGFEVIGTEQLVGIESTLYVLRGPAGGKGDAGASLTAARQAAPQSVFALNHIFGLSADAPRPGDGPGAPPPRGKACACRLGMIDTGVDSALPGLRALALHQRPFGAASGRPQGHGDEVASLIAGLMSGDQGPSAGAELFVADIYAGGPQSGSAASLVSALSWMAEGRVAVVNVSLTGPPNPVVEAVVARLGARGVTVVAAAGNDGPAAPAVFPAAYSGVVAVTALDSQRRPYRYANRGPYLMFAARGVDMRLAGPGGGVQVVSGTSFASPVVAVELARALSRPDAAAAQRALHGLAARAIDLGAPGRDPVFGFGLIEPLP